MAKSLRSKSVRRNKRLLRTNVFQPVIDDRTNRLADRLRDQVNDLTDKKDNNVAEAAQKEVVDASADQMMTDEAKSKASVSTSGPRNSNRDIWAKKHLKKGGRQKKSKFAKFLKK
ncbi:fungal protein [Schizosaccharomyces japonicus yFS275]|uniref:Fungal protein n=1 Tax=Schizosaccharomyces japonicus (strain yFS275 / FY16936) TaxID=402676 RepID=B6K397_SCHJY|nr:fungal protein [Schizosaccharomyces japonicus yFS275]EEB07954.1 fungal protein [Schizosaccharomyces japonicus yFS275]